LITKKFESLNDPYPEKVNASSIISGCLIGIGVIANTVIENKYIGAMLFSLALLTIIKCGFQLYTGRIGYTLDKRHRVEDYIFIFLGNYIGIFLTFVFWYFTQDELTQIAMEEIADTKFSKCYDTMFVAGILCGILMMVAVYAKETIITVFCIMTFILSGFEHCIADIPYALITTSEIPMAEVCIKLFLVILGNSIGSICIYALIKLSKLGGENHE
jgi:formate/nitrite transporter FocA (FNT family)